VLIDRPRRGYVSNCVNVKAHRDNAVNVAAPYLNPSTFEVVIDEIFYSPMSTMTEYRGGYFIVKVTEEKGKE